MLGAEVLLSTLVANGVRLCIANPGTSEMQFVAALDRVPGMRSVLCLFEGVCAGAADGYARMLRKPAATLLHLGPGLANGLSNFHNAQKAHSPVVSIVGEHATWHRRFNSPLANDVEGFARPVSGWVHMLEAADQMGEAASSAVSAAYGPPGTVATLIVPADFSWSEAGQPGRVAPIREPARVPSERIKEIACLLRSGDAVGFFLAGTALLGRGLDAAGRLAASTGVRMVANRYAGRMERGRGRFPLERLAYFPEEAEKTLAGLKHLVLVETEAPVSFFGYPGRRSELAPEDCVLHVLAGREENGAEALGALAGEFGARPMEPAAFPDDGTSKGPLTPESIGRLMATLLPENAIISEEAVSSVAVIERHVRHGAPHDWLPVAGGAIGQGLPVAVGAALACPDRKVVALEADGSSMYTPQSLWTMARERLDVTVVVLANRRYRILEIEMIRTGSGSIGPQADALMDLHRPELDWVLLANGMGVEATRAETAEDFRKEFAAAMRGRGPRLIEAVI
ncbi:MAG: acetolactate synthase large subunit [Terriglobia bacterium]|jgi:acetolactate synthase-1/2/3 large subunit